MVTPRQSPRGSSTGPAGRLILGRAQFQSCWKRYALATFIAPWHTRTVMVKPSPVPDSTSDASSDRLRADARRNQRHILRTAARLLAEDPATTMQRIADECG